MADSLTGEALKAIQAREPQEYVRPSAHGIAFDRRQQGVLLTVSERDQLVQAAQREARETCGTCRHAGTATSGTRECYHPEFASLGHDVFSVPEKNLDGTLYGCTLHAPLPASPADERHNATLVKPERKSDWFAESEENR